MPWSDAARRASAEVRKRNAALNKQHRKDREFLRRPGRRSAPTADIGFGFRAQLAKALKAARHKGQREAKVPGMRWMPTTSVAQMAAHSTFARNYRRK